jgi:hypothetical protein
VGKEIDNAFKLHAKGRIPDWAEPMVEYSKAVEWMRRQHWKNNRNKGELALGEARAGARDEDEERAGTGAGAVGYWSDVLR